MAPALKELERRLLVMLCSDDDRVGRQEVRRCIQDGACTKPSELAWRNGLAASLFDRISAFSPEQAHWFTAKRDNSKVPGFDNADTAAIQRECGAISRAFAVGGARAVVVKGASVARHYPSWLRRHQKDMDIAVPDLQAALILAEVLQSRGFLQEALAVRMDAHGRLVGAVSFVRPDLADRQVMWCDVWIGVQPLATDKSIDLEAAFWASLRHDLDGLVPSPAQCLRILCAEVEERSTLLLKDVFDCRALLCAGVGSGVSKESIDMPGWHHLQEACAARDDPMRSAFGRCGPELSSGASVWQPLPLNGTLSGSGVSVRNDLAGYEGSGFVGSFTNTGDTLTLGFPNLAAGIYTVRIRYHAWTNQQNNLVVNGALRNESFPATGSGWAVKSVSGVALAGGSNSIAVTKDWGHMDVDWIEIAP